MNGCAEARLERFDWRDEARMLSTVMSVLLVSGLGVGWMSNPEW